MFKTVKKPTPTPPNVPVPKTVVEDRPMSYADKLAAKAKVAQATAEKERQATYIKEAEEKWPLFLEKVERLAAFGKFYIDSDDKFDDHSPSVNYYLPQWKAKLKELGFRIFTERSCERISWGRE